MNINILTNNADPCSRAFNCPLILCRKLFSEEEISLKFFFNKTKKLYHSDVLFINSNVFRPFWQKDKKEIFKTLENSRKHQQKIVWFDTTDSTWCTQFEVLPYVDLFLKNQIFQDRKHYLKQFRTGRVFTDFFDDLYHTGEAEYEYAIPAAEELNKIDISWASCFENYNESRYSLPNKIRNFVRPFTANFLPEKLLIDFGSPIKNRTQNISARFGLGHTRPSVVAHRKAVKSVLEKFEVDCSRIPLSDYFKELKNSKISVSPFGVGEFCYRDYESIICGTVLVKPDMSHMSTWPDFYQADKTFIAYRWDLADLSEKLEYLLGNPVLCQKIAENAQSLYRQSISPEGRKEFVDRIILFLKRI